MINRLAVGFWKACLCQFAWWGRIFKVGLAFIACWRGAEGAVIPGWSCLLRGTSELLNVGQAVSRSLPSYGTWVSGIGAFGLLLWPQLLLYPTCPQWSQVQLSLNGLSHEESESLRHSVLTMTFCIPGALEVKTGCQALLSTSGMWMEDPWAVLFVEYLAPAVRWPAPVSVIRLLLTEKQERGSCGIWWSPTRSPHLFRYSLSPLRKIGLLGAIPYDLKNP